MDRRYQEIQQVLQFRITLVGRLFGLLSSEMATIFCEWDLVIDKLQHILRNFGDTCPGAIRSSALNDISLWRTRDFSPFDFYT
jgi:hypothetical protein